MPRFNNLCYHCGTPLVYGRWQVNVFRTEEFAPSKRGAEMFLCPTCGIGWEVLHTNSGLAYPSFMADGHEWRGPINQRPAAQRSKDTPMTSRWVPVNEGDLAPLNRPTFADTATIAHFSIRLTCTCGGEHHFDEGGTALWACENCGRVYRTQARFWVEEHMGDG